MKSKITGGETTLLFTAKLLNKYDVKYYRCNDTGFIQTEDPYWLDEAYSSAIASLDVGLVMRNLNLSRDVERIINNNFDYSKKFLDFAGGYGMFTRLMRDKGFDFYNTDKYCQDLFADHFELEDAGTDKFEIVTAFEVFEHLVNPMAEIAELFKYSDNILFSTEIVPDINTIKGPSDWWYFVPEIGQHIAFYTIDALKYIAEKNNVHLYTNGQSLHLFSKKVFDNKPLAKPGRDPFMVRKLKKILQSLEGKPIVHQALLDHDISHIKSKMFDNKL
jgi:hypothetical protein